LTEAQDESQNYRGTKQNVESKERGLLFKSFKPLTDEVPQGAPISLEYDLELKNVEVDAMPLKVYCGISEPKFDEDEVRNNVQILPNEEIVVSGDKIYDDVRCLVSPELTKKMKDTVTFEGSVSFLFKTKDVIMPVYFTTKSVQTMLDGRDFFSYFKINERNPITVTYNGEPVEVSIGVSTSNEQPLVVGDNRNPLVGISLKNKWSGKMVALTSLVLTVPKEMKINEDLSLNPNPLCPFVLMSEEDNVNKYIAVEDIINKIALDARRRQTFECWFDVDENIVEPGALYGKKYYKVDAEYIYSSEKKTAPVTIKTLGEKEDSTSEAVVRKIIS